MGSFTGDMLRILASGGMKLGTELLTTAIAAPMLAKRQSNLEQLKEAYKMSPYVSDEGMPALNKFIESVGGKPLPSFMGKTGNVVLPTGETAAMTPRPGAPVTPEMKEQFLRAPATLNELLGTKLLQDPEKLDAFLGTRSGTAMTAAQEARNKAQLDQIELGRQRLLETSLHNQAYENLRNQSLTIHRELMDTRKKLWDVDIDKKKAELEQINDKERQKSIALVHKDYMTAVKNMEKETDPQKKEAYYNEAVAHLSHGRKLHPTFFGNYPEPLKTEVQPSWLSPRNLTNAVGLTSPKYDYGVTGQVPELPAAAPTAGAPMGKPRTGTVQSGPNKGKRVTVYPDGRKVYE